MISTFCFARRAKATSENTKIARPKNEQPNTSNASLLSQAAGHHALRAGRELTAGRSRTHTSIAEVTGKEPSATSREGSNAALMEVCNADERRLHQRRWKANCIERRNTARSEETRNRARSLTKRMQSACQRPPIPTTRTTNA